MLAGSGVLAQPKQMSAEEIKTACHKADADRDKWDAWLGTRIAKCGDSPAAQDARRQRVKYNAAAEACVANPTPEALNETGKAFDAYQADLRKVEALPCPKADDRASRPSDQVLGAGDDLSPAAALAQARDYLTKMKEAHAKVRQLQDKARRKKDVLMLNCVNDKEIKIGGHIAVADNGDAGGTIQRMTAAVNGDPKYDRKHEFTRMTILYQKVVVLSTEAENCIGEDASYVGATKIEVEVDPNIPDEDPTQPTLPLPDVTRPPEASPFV
jgi:hypothetical protein